MELKITVSEADFGTELSTILNSLSLEEKKEIAKEVMLKSLNEITDSQRTAKEKDLNVLKKVKDYVGSYQASSYDTDEKLRTHHKYSEYMREVKSSKEIAVEQILQAATSSFKDNAKLMIENDENLKKMWSAASDQIKEDFPKYIHSAMTYYFASKMGEVQQGIQTALFESQNARMDVNNIKQRIGA